MAEQTNDFWQLAPEHLPLYLDLIEIYREIEAEIDSCCQMCGENLKHAVGIRQIRLEVQTLVAYADLLAAPAPVIAEGRRLEMRLTQSENTTEITPALLQQVKAYQEQYWNALLVNHDTYLVDLASPRANVVRCMHRQLIRARTLKRRPNAGDLFKWGIVPDDILDWSDNLPPEESENAVGIMLFALTEFYGLSPHTYQLLVDTFGDVDQELVAQAVAVWRQIAH